MHRFPAALLLFAFSFALIKPVVFAGSDAQLPACCRKHGKHGCSKTKASHEESGLAFKAPGKCGMFPMSSVAPATGKTFVPTGSSPITVDLVAHPAGSTQTEARYRVSFSRSWQKRGPPLQAV